MAYIFIVKKHKYLFLAQALESFNLCTKLELCIKTYKKTKRRNILNTVSINILRSTKVIVIFCLTDTDRTIIPLLK